MPNNSKCSVSDISRWIISTLASPDSTFTPPSKKLVDNHVMRAIDNFYRDTLIVKKTIKLDLQCGVDDYPIEVSECYEIGELYEVICEGTTLRPHDDYEKKDDVLFLSFEPCSDVRNGLILEISVIPCIDACGIPDEICGEYRESIIAKVLSEFYSMPNMDWANPGLYREMDTKYRRLSTQVRRSNRRNKISAPERLQPRSFL